MVKEKPLSELISFISRGVTPKYVDSEGYVVLNQKCIRENKVLFENSRLTDKNKKFPDEKFLVNYDVLVNSTGVGTLGRVAQIKNVLGRMTVDSHVMIIRPNDQIDHEYFGYTMILNQPKIESMGEGATGQTELSRDRLKKEVMINVPIKIETQRKIAKILSNYDKLIENDEKRIKLLEQIAKLLYEEWFVNYRFPGHEDTKMIDSKTDFGEIPEGWEVGKLGDRIKVFRGKNITKATITEGTIPVVAGGLDPAYYHNVYNVRAPAITISASGANAGFTRLYFENIWASDCSFINQDSTSFVYYTFLLMRNKEKEINNLQRGSAQPHVYAKDLMNLDLVFPDENLIRKFENMVELIFKEIACLNLKNKNLRRTKDLLLPKLISGEIDVSNLDIEINKPLEVVA